MVKKRGLFLLGFVLFAAVFLAGFGSAAPTFTHIGWVENPDNFYSPYETWINVSVSVANETGGYGTFGIGAVLANFTSINSTACGGTGYLNLTYTLGGTWTGNCSVSSFFTNKSQINPIGGNITFVARNLSGYNVSTTQPLVIIMHNLGVPNMSAQGVRFGSATTNLSNETNFNSVNLVFDVEGNLSLLSGGAVNLPTYQDIFLATFSGLNLSDPNTANTLGQFGNAVNVTIDSPRAFGNSRIYINTGLIASLNATATLKFYNLPFTTAPNIVQDVGAAGVSGSSTWDSNGFVSAFNTTTGNLTFVVNGFSGYNITDNTAPSISILTPGTATNLTSFVLNVSVNGTGTEPSKIAINITNSTGQFNYTMYNLTVNTARCTAATAGGELYYCALNFSSLAEGNYTVNVTAWDYGGASPGNVNTLTQTTIVDRTAPVIASLGSPAHTTTEMNWTVSITEDGSGINGHCTASSGWSVTGSGNDQTVSKTGLTCGNTYAVSITCTDNAGNSANVSGSHATNGCSSSDGGGGGGDDSPSGEFWAVSYYFTDNQFKNGSTKTIKEKERMMFRVNGTFHHVGAIDIYSDRVTINVSSDYSQQTDIDLGETLNFDVTGDGYYDVSVTLTNITSNATRASFTVGAISESVPVTTSTPSTTNNQTSNRTITVTPPTTSAPVASGTSIFKKTWFWIVVLILAAGIGVGVWYYLKVRKARGY